MPKPHVEAPIAGSMILAGVMLKLGGYGLMRFMVVFNYVGLKLNLFILIFSLMGGFWVSLMCLRQMDIKSMIAYSSVSHMALVLSGSMTMNFYGLLGQLIMMIGQGLCSSGLFCLTNFSYERISSRSFFLNKSLINLLHNLSMWWFIFCSFSMAAPPLLNLLGEIMLINWIMCWSVNSMILLMLLSFLGASYSLYLYSFSLHGKLFSSLYSFYLITSREYVLNYFILFL